MQPDVLIGVLSGIVGVVLGDFILKQVHKHFVSPHLLKEHSLDSASGMDDSVYSIRFNHFYRKFVITGSILFLLVTLWSHDNMEFPELFWFLLTLAIILVIAAPRWVLSSQISVSAAGLSYRNGLWPAVTLHWQDIQAMTFRKAQNDYKIRGRRGSIPLSCYMDGYQDVLERIERCTDLSD